MTLPTTNENYLKLVQSIGETIEEARNRAVKDSAKVMFT